MSQQVATEASAAPDMGERRGVWARFLGGTSLLGAAILIGCGGAAAGATAGDHEADASGGEADPSGLVVVESDAGFDEVIGAVEEALASRELQLMAKVDHTAGARRAGLELRPTVLFIFGKPQSGTPLMQDAATVAIDLPQKLLVVATDEGSVRIVYNDPVHLARRHGLAVDDPRIAGIAGVLASIADEAANP